MSKTLIPLLAGAALMLTAGAAVAHDPAQAAREAAQDARAAAEKARKEAYAARDEARREARAYRGHRGHDVLMLHGGDRAENLRTLLQLRPNQEAALTAYLEAVGGKGAGKRDFIYHFDKRGDARTTAERLAEMEQRMDEQQAAMRKRIEATKAFYAQLDDRQKKVFDALPMLMFAGPGFGPMLMPVHMPLPPEPPAPPKPPAPPRGL